MKWAPQFILFLIHPGHALLISFLPVYYLLLVTRLAATHLGIPTLPTYFYYLLTITFTSVVPNREYLYPPSPRGYARDPQGVREKVTFN